MPTPTATMPEPAGPSCLRVDFAASWRVDGPHHYVYRVPCLQLILVDTGRLRARVGGRWWQAGPGDLLCLGREPRNEYGWDGSAAFWECHLTLDAPASIDGAALPAVLTLAGRAAEVRSAMETLCQELDRPGDVHRLRVQAAAWHILGAIAGALGRAPAPAPRDPWQRVRDRLDADLHRPLSATALAREAGMTADGLIRAFRRRHGISPMAWRARAKMRQACRLLAEGQAVKSVAAGLGFADASAFARTFRRHIGIPPSEYATAGPASSPPAPAEAGRPYPLNRHVLASERGGRAFAWI